MLINGLIYIQCKETIIITSLAPKLIATWEHAFDDGKAPSKVFIALDIRLLILGMFVEEDNDYAKDAGRNVCGMD